MALARGQEYLYGFKPSELPQELLDQVEAAGEETRKLAYVRCVSAHIGGGGDARDRACLFPGDRRARQQHSSSCVGCNNPLSNVL